MKRSGLFVLAFVLWAGVVVGQLAVPSVIGDHMVMKQNSDFRLWGWSNPGAALVITNTWNKDTLKVRANSVGDWQTTLKTPGAGGPYEMKIRSGHDELNIRDILSGEVWLCTGQSNMEWNGVRGLKQIKNELPHCENSQIRFFQVSKRVSAAPQDNLSGAWVVCDAASLDKFSAIGYFFGKTLYNELQCPMGLIGSNWGGTPVEFWMPGQSWENNNLEKLRLKEGGWASRASQGYNAMIYPLVKYDITGVIWYQGESNVFNNAGYSELFSAMIQSWRSAFKKDFPFYYVQIAPYAGWKQPFIGALLREQQEKTLAIPKTGMVVVMDLVSDTNNIHPQQKREVGERLAAMAAKEVYGKEKAPYFPRYKSMIVAKNKVIISFTDVTAPLVIKGKQAQGVQVAGEDRRFYPAVVKVDGDKIIVSAKEVKNPVAVRYAFGNATIGNLAGVNGLPVAPFRTDRWPIGGTGK